MNPFFQETNSKIEHKLQHKNRISDYASIVDESFGESQQVKYFPLPIEDSIKQLQTASFVYTTNYYPLSVGQDPLGLAWKLIHNLSNKDLIQQAKKLLLTIQNALYVFQPFLVDLSCIPLLQAATPEDGSILFEWIFSDYRIGFSIEPNSQESSWFLITKKNLGEICASGFISDIDLNKLISWLLYFIISYS